MLRSVCFLVLTLTIFFPVEGFSIRPMWNHQDFSKFYEGEKAKHNRHMCYFRFSPGVVEEFVQKALTTELYESEKESINLVFLLGDDLSKIRTSDYHDNLNYLSRKLDGIDVRDCVALIKAIASAGEVYSTRFMTLLASQILESTQDRGLISAKMGCILEEKELLFPGRNDNESNDDFFVTLFLNEIDDIAEFVGVAPYFSHVIAPDKSWLKKLQRKRDSDLFYRKTGYSRSKQSYFPGQVTRTAHRFWRRLLGLKQESRRYLASYVEMIFLPLGSIRIFDEPSIQSTSYYYTYSFPTYPLRFLCRYESEKYRVAEQMRDYIVKQPLFLDYTKQETKKKPHDHS